MDELFRKRRRLSSKEFEQTKNTLKGYSDINIDYLFRMSFNEDTIKVNKESFKKFASEYLTIQNYEVFKINKNVKQFTVKDVLFISRYERKVFIQSVLVGFAQFIGQTLLYLGY